MVEILTKTLDTLLTDIALINQELLKYPAETVMGDNIEAKVKAGGLRAKKMASELQFKIVAKIITDLNEELKEEYSSFLNSLTSSIDILVDIKDGKIVYNPEIDKFLKAKNGK